MGNNFNTNFFLLHFFVLKFFNHVPTPPSSESECLDKQQGPVLDVKIDTLKTSGRDDEQGFLNYILGYF